ncbi:kinase-like domain-containing protein [Hypoxylon sp. FL0890]|nr:kinase-like domain-containing protein [Hypoxylon sp. FL0890]
MNPYEADPAKIPDTDRYSDSLLYGRYKPCASDFVPNPPPGPSTSDDVIRYWERVILDKCTQANRMYEMDGYRDTFAVGSIIVKSGHLHSKPLNRVNALGDANEVAAIALAGDFCRKLGIQVPTILFQGKINENDVIVESRLPGVTLNVAWPYLTQAEKESFREQARELIKKLDELPRPPNVDPTVPSFVIPVADPVGSGVTDKERYEALFGKRDDVESEEKLGFAHNDLNDSNIIVQDGKITGLIDWELAGWFGIKRAGFVQAHLRFPGQGDYPDRDEDEVADLIYWSLIYEGL